MHCPACAGRFLVHQETRCRSEFAFPAQIEENLWEPEKALLGPAARRGKLTRAIDEFEHLSAALLGL